MLVAEVHFGESEQRAIARRQILERTKRGRERIHFLIRLSLALELFPADDGSSPEDHYDPEEDKAHAVWDSSDVSPQRGQGESGSDFAYVHQALEPSGKVKRWGAGIQISFTDLPQTLIYLSPP